MSFIKTAGIYGQSQEEGSQASQLMSSSVITSSKVGMVYFIVSEITTNV